MGIYCQFDDLFNFQIKPLIQIFFLCLLITITNSNELIVLAIIKDIIFNSVFFISISLALVIVISSALIADSFL